jgi:Xaa-Pro aminopeptidase
MNNQKNKQKLFYTTKAAKITEKILRRIIKICQQKGLQQKISEYELAMEIYKQAINRGCPKLAFPPIVAFGSNTRVPHHQPNRFRYLKRGDMILIDLGVKYQNYCADLTRTFFTAPPSTGHAEIYQKVLLAQKQAIKKIKAGAQASKLYSDVCNGFGSLASHFTHGLGHGVGLKIHQRPNLKERSPDILKSGQILTVEPGLYFSWGGVRIEDLVAVRTDSCHILAKPTKELSKIII